MHVLTGFHAIEERIKAALTGKTALPGRLLVCGNGPRVKEILALAQKARVAFEQTDSGTLNRFSTEHRGIILILDAEEESSKIGLSEYLELKAESEKGLVLVLDHISDPHNYGAILRSADAFGVDLVIVPDRRSAKETDVVARASAGASAWVQVSTVPNLARALTELKEAGFWIYAADMGGENAAGFKAPPKLALVMGAEGAGVSRLLKEQCDGAISVPMRGKVDSLNVSVATGVLLFAVTSHKR